MFHIEVQTLDDNKYQSYFVKATDYGKACEKLAKSVGPNVKYKLLGQYDKSELFHDVFTRTA